MHSHFFKIKNVMFLWGLAVEKWKSLPEIRDSCFVLFCFNFKGTFLNQCSQIPTTCFGKSEC